MSALSANVATPASDKEPEAVAHPVSVTEAFEMLQREQAARAEMTYEQKLALDHAQVFARVPADKARELKAKLREISPRVTEFHAAKIVDVTPTHADDVKAVFARDRSPLDAAEIDKILDAVRAYL